MGKLDNATRAMFYLGIVIGFSFGVLGNFIVTLFFRLFGDELSHSAEYLGFGLALIGTGIVLVICYYKIIQLLK